MQVIDALKQRHSTRAFTDKGVSKSQITCLLTAASYSPSGANLQPWQVAVISGNTKKKLGDILEQAFYADEKPAPEYAYYPTTWKAPYNHRRKACGLQLYKSLNIEKTDIEARKAQWAANYRAFDAPVVLLFFVDKSMSRGSFIDYGMFLQSLMLAAQEQGLATCPQAAFADYPEHVKSLLGYSDEVLLIGGMALGYEAISAPVNSYRTPRAEPSTFSRYFD